MTGITNSCSRCLFYLESITHLQTGREARQSHSRGYIATRGKGLRTTQRSFPLGEKCSSQAEEARQAFMESELQKSPTATKLLGHKDNPAWACVDLCGLIKYCWDSKTRWSLPCPICSSHLPHHARKSPHHSQEKHPPYI